MSSPNEKLVTDLTRIFKKVMGEHVIINLDTRRNNLSEWDSINHLDLIVELEENYQLDLSMEQIEQIDSIAVILKLIVRKKE